jgi:hypothetical protein
MSNVSTQVPSLDSQEEPPGAGGRAPAVELDEVGKHFDAGAVKALDG